MGVDLKVVIAHGYLLTSQQYEELCCQIDKLLCDQRKRKRASSHKHGGKRAKVAEAKQDSKEDAKTKTDGDKHSKQPSQDTKDDDKDSDASATTAAATSDDEEYDLRFLGAMLDGGPVGVLEQDGYGNSEGDMCVFIYWEKTAQIVIDRKVGFTPFSFLRTQVYTGNPEEIHGGAQKAFAVAIDHLDAEPSEQLLADKKAVDDCLTLDEDRRIFELGRLLSSKHSKTFGKWLVSCYL